MTTSQALMTSDQVIRAISASQRAGAPSLVRDVATTVEQVFAASGTNMMTVDEFIARIPSEETETQLIADDSTDSILPSVSIVVAAKERVEQPPAPSVADAYVQLCEGVLEEANTLPKCERAVYVAAAVQSLIEQKEAEAVRDIAEVRHAVLNRSAARLQQYEQHVGELEQAVEHGAQQQQRGGRALRAVRLLTAQLAALRRRRDELLATTSHLNDSNRRLQRQLAQLESERQALLQRVTALQLQEHALFASLEQQQHSLAAEQQQHTATSNSLAEAQSVNALVSAELSAAHQDCERLRSELATATAHAAEERAEAEQHRLRDARELERLRALLRANGIADSAAGRPSSPKPAGHSRTNSNSVVAVPLSAELQEAELEALRQKLKSYEHALRLFSQFHLRKKADRQREQGQQPAGSGGKQTKRKRIANALAAAAEAAVEDSVVIEQPADVDAKHNAAETQLTVAQPERQSQQQQQANNSDSHTRRHALNKEKKREKVSGDFSDVQLLAEQQQEQERLACARRNINTNSNSSAVTCTHTISIVMAGPAELRLTSTATVTKTKSKSKAKERQLVSAVVAAAGSSADCCKPAPALVEHKEAAASLPLLVQ